MRFAIFIITTCCIVACRPGDVTDIPVNPKRIVVQSQPERGKPFEVYVSHTLPLLDSMTHFMYRPPVVENAKVKLFDGDQFIEDLVATGPDTEMQKFVGSTNGPVAGHSYNIKVEAPGYESVMGRYTHPPVVPIDNIDVTPIREEMYRYNPESAQIYVQFNIDLTFTDPPGDNYYSLAIIRANSPDLNTATIVMQEFLYSRTVDYQNQQNEYGSFLTDKKFPGQPTTLVFSCFMGLAYNNGAVDTPYIFISLRNLSKELFDYRAFIVNPGPSYYDPYAQPSIVKTNIQNGLGVFAGFSADTKSFQYQPK